MEKPHGKSFSRRAFLKLAGTATLAGIAASCSPAPAAEPTKIAADSAAQAPTNNPAPAEQITLVYGRHDEGRGEQLNIDAFMQENPNVKIDMQVIGSFAERVPAMTAAGTLPDVLRSWEAMCLELARANQIVDIQPWVDAQSDFKPDDFYENWWNWPVLDGKRYGVPDAVAPHVTFYNADLFDAKGVPYPNKDNFTWADYENLARQITDVPNKVWGSETIPVGWTYWHLKMVWQNGGEYFTPDYKKCIIDSPETIEAIQHWADMLLAGEVMPSPTQIVDVGGGGAVAELMAAGKIGMMHDGVWNANTLIEANIRYNMVPEPSNKRRDTITHGAFNAIPSTTKNKDLAWKWINTHCSTEGIYNYASGGKFPGARKSTNQKTPYSWQVDLPFEVNWDVVPQALEYGHVLPGPAFEGEALRVIGDALQAIYQGDAKAADIFPQIAPQVTDILNQ